MRSSKHLLEMIEIGHYGFNTIIHIVGRVGAVILLTSSMMGPVLDDNIFDSVSCYA
jgi:hypothetical protein